MSTINLYDSSVGVILRELGILKKILKIGEAWCDEQGKPHSVLLEHSLAPDMKVCCNYAKFAMTRVGKSEDLVIEDNEKTFAELYDRIDRLIEFLKTAKREDFNEPDKAVELKYPGLEVNLNALTYNQRMILPNFYFHATASYLILRNAGVPVGKRDFLDADNLAA